MKKLWNKISFRIIILTVIVFVPVLIFLIIFNIQSTHSATAALIQENQGNLDTAAQQLDNILEVTETLLKTMNNDSTLLDKIRYYKPRVAADAAEATPDTTAEIPPDNDANVPPPVDDDDLPRDNSADTATDAPTSDSADADADAPKSDSAKADADAPKSDSTGSSASGEISNDTESEYYRAVQLLFNHLQDSLAASDFTQNAFIYFPEQELFYNSKKEAQMTEYLNTIIQSDMSGGPVNLMDTYQKSWAPVYVGSQWYILRIWRYNPKANGYYIGAWFSVDALRDSIHVSINTDYDRLFIANGRGTYLNSNGLYINPNTIASGDMVHDSKGSDITGSGRTSEDYYYIYTLSEKAPIRLIKLLNTKTVKSLSPDISLAIFIMFLCFAMLILLFTVCIRRWLLSPISSTMRSMDRIRSGDIDHRIPVNSGDCVEFTSLNTLFNNMMDQVNQLKNEIYEGQLERQEIRLEYLQQQIQPHFILNTLNTLYNHTEDDIQKEIILLMTKYYRFVVNIDSRYVQLGQELDHIKNYLKLQQIRYPHAFEYEIRCESSLEIIPVPPFLIESFVGNTIKHALNFSDCVFIRIEAYLLDTFTTRIRISDTGEGFEDEVLDMINDYLENKTISEELGVGIRNSIERLRLIYHDNAAIRLYNQESGGAVVEIDLSLQMP